MASKSHKQRILVVEDSPTQAQELRIVLEEAGFDVECAADGEHGLEAVSRRTFDLVITDVVMPGLSGYELCRRIKSAPQRQRAPVIILTMLNEPQDFLRGLECGADGFVGKPYEPEALVARVATVLANRGLRGRQGAAEGVRLELEGATAVVTPDASQLLGLLLSTFEELRSAKEKERAMKPALEAAEAAIRSRNDLTAVVSHEIRTPLNGIMGLTGLLLETEISIEQRRFLEGIKNSAESLLKMIADILDFSRVEAGKIELEKIDFDLYETLGNAVKSLAPQAHRKGLELTYEIRPDVPDALAGDPARLWQVVVNLVGNAVKFTEQGEVSIVVETETLEPDSAVLRITVRDTGIGIPSERQAALLQPLRQVDASVTRKYGGAGLGLPISSRLVELMGGRIWFESEEGRGSQFHFTARFCLQAAPSQRPLPHPRLDGLNVLLVDDNATSRRILKELLRQWRVVATEASNGPDALSILHDASWREGATGLVLLDAAMPGMDGFTLLEEIRREPEIDGPVVIMLSSLDERNDLARCRYLAANAHVQKPVIPSDLQDAIVTALRLSVLQTDQRRRAAGEFKGRSLRVLVAEDDSINQLFAVRLLEKAGHFAVAVRNGKEAVSACLQSPFDVVLMDLQMPFMDGIEATSLIRKHDAQTGKHTPIIAMTGRAGREDRERCLQAGMDGHVAKPIQTSELFAALAALVSEENKAPDQAALSATATAGTAK